MSARWTAAVPVICLVLPFLMAAGAEAAVSAVDGSGREIRLAQPARRIVSLSPHITELLFAAGAGDRVAAAVDFSDYPAAARKLPRVGNHQLPDLERLLAFKPDLVVVWSSGNAAGLADRLRGLGLTVFASEPRRLEGIPLELERLGHLAGADAAARRAATDFRTRLARLRAAQAGKPPVPVFFQIWPRPLMTVNGSHVISDLLRLCGGENLFDRLPALAPTVDPEAVLAAAPEAIIASTDSSGDDAGLDQWRRWPQLPAVARGNLFVLSGDLVTRQTPRILEGAEQLCTLLDTVRARRK
jgi:iron complex transport system substrate-binding protein